MRSHFAYCCALGAASIVAAAGPGLTLEQAMRKAEQSDPGIRASQAEVEAAEAGAVSAGAWPNPTLAAGPGLKQATGAGPGTEFHGELSLEQTFEYPGKRSLRIRQAEGEIRLRELEREALVHGLRIEVRRAFFEAVAAGQVAALRQGQVQSAETFLSAARKRVAGGYASDFESMKAQADLIAARRALGDASGRAGQAKLRLASLMGSFPDTAFGLAGTLDSTTFAGPEGDALALALDHHPAIKARTLEVELSRNSLRAAGLALRPDLSLAPSLEYDRDERIYSLTVSLPLPLWNRGKGEGRKAEAECRAAQAELEKAGQEVALAVRAAEQKVGLARARLALYTPAFLADLKSIMERAEKVYGQSSTTLLIYLESRRSYFESLSDYYEALAAWADGHLDLEAAMGFSPAPATLIAPNPNGVK